VEGDRILVDKMAFGLRVPLTHHWLVSAAGPRRGDVVVLSSPEDGDTLVKRVMGLPGETVVVRGGVVYADGRAVERRVSGAANGLDYGPILLGESEYLVLGDNRGNSHDGRAFGPVPRETIHGRVEAVVWRGGFTWLGM
jgi:signal peptidase I